MNCQFSLACSNIDFNATVQAIRQEATPILMLGIPLCCHWRWFWACSVDVDVFDFFGLRQLSVYCIICSSKQANSYLFRKLSYHVNLYMSGSICLVVTNEKLYGSFSCFFCRCYVQCQSLPTDLLTLATINLILVKDQLYLDILWSRSILNTSEMCSWIALVQ